MRSYLTISIALFAIVLTLIIVALEASLVIPFLASFVIGVVLLGLMNYYRERIGQPKHPEQDLRKRSVRSVHRAFVVAVLSGTASFFILFAVDHLMIDLEWMIGVIPLLLVVCFGALIRLAWLLLLRRSYTQYPIWTVAIGGLIAAAAVLSLIVPSALFRQMADMASSAPPPDAFSVRHKAIVHVLSTDSAVAWESYEIRPKSHFTALSVRQVDEGVVFNEQIELFERFQDGDYDGAPLEGIRITYRRPISLHHERLGMLRSKHFVRLTPISITARSVRDTVENAAYDSTRILYPQSQTRSVSLARMVDLNSEIEMRMPKNAMLASYPAGLIASLPDRDVVTLSSFRFDQEIELYYIHHASLRFGPVKELLTASSDLDLLLKWLTWLFWPVAMVLIGAFRQDIIQRATKVLRGIFGRKPEPRNPIGFRT